MEVNKKNVPEDFFLVFTSKIINVRNWANYLKRQEIYIHTTSQFAWERFFLNFPLCCYKEFWGREHLDFFKIPHVDFDGRCVYEFVQIGPNNNQSKNQVQYKRLWGLNFSTYISHAPQYQRSLDTRIFEHGYSIRGCREKGRPCTFTRCVIVRWNRHCTIHFYLMCTLVFETKFSLNNKVE